MFGSFFCIRHRNPMRRQCQFTVKRPERSVDLTVAPKQQPCGVQVVERVGLVTSGFLQFITRLAAVFAEEVGDFLVTVHSSLIQRSPTKISLRIHIRPFGD